MILKEVIDKIINKKIMYMIEIRLVVIYLRNFGNFVNINLVWGLGFDDKCIF